MPHHSIASLCANRRHSKSTKMYILKSTTYMSGRMVSCGKYFPGYTIHICTSKVTGHHRGPKRKLRAGHRAPSRHLHPMCRHSYFCLLNVFHCNARHIFHRRVWYRALSLRYARAMRAFDVRASSSPSRLPLCEISFLSRPLL